MRDWKPCFNRSAHAHRLRTTRLGPRRRIRRQAHQHHPPILLLFLSSLGLEHLRDDLLGKLHAPLPSTPVRPGHPDLLRPDCGRAGSLGEHHGSYRFRREMFRLERQPDEFKSTPTSKMRITGLTLISSIRLADYTFLKPRTTYKVLRSPPAKRRLPRKTSRSLEEV